MHIRAKPLVRLLSLAAATALVGFATLPAAAQVNPHAAVFDNGAEAAVAPATGATVSPSFAGRGRILAPHETDDALANFPAGDTATDLARIRSARPMSAPVGVEAVIGSDQRVRVTPTTTYPARATVWILFNAGAGTASCTGWLINKNTVITAGHCVADGGSGNFYSRASFRIYPGRNGSTSPYGSCTAKWLATVNGWINSGLDDYDYGAIKLNCSIGNTVGWYGYTQHSNPQGIPVTIQGYPGDKPSGTHWKDSDPISVVQARRLFYKVDTAAGESGSAVWYNKSATCRVCSLAIHAYGTYGGYPFSGNNHGTRIIAPVFNNLTSWKNAS